LVKKLRKQFVQMGVTRSPLLDIICGVPQGSILGPKLFVLYINDICNVYKILNYVIFADDTNVFCAWENLQQLLEVVTAELSKLKLWFDVNKLSVNRDAPIRFFGADHRNQYLPIR